MNWEMPMDIIEDKIQLNKLSISGVHEQHSKDKLILRLMLPEEPVLHEPNDYTK